MWYWSLFEQLLNTQRMGLPFPTHKTKIKWTIKITNPKQYWKKKREKGKPTRKNRDK